MAASLMLHPTLPCLWWRVWVAVGAPSTPSAYNHSHRLEMLQMPCQGKQQLEVATLRHPRLLLLLLSPLLPLIQLLHLLVQQLQRPLPGSAPHARAGQNALAPSPSSSSPASRRPLTAACHPPQQAVTTWLRSKQRCWPPCSAPRRRRCTSCPPCCTQRCLCCPWMGRPMAQVPPVAPPPIRLPLQWMSPLPLPLPLPLLSMLFLLHLLWLRGPLSLSIHTCPAPQC